MINHVGRTNQAKPVFANFKLATNPIKPNMIGLNSDVFVRSTVSNVSNVSFTSVDDGPDGRAIRELKGVPCPYCGLPVLSGKEAHKAIESPVVEGRSDMALASIKEFEPSLHPVAKQAYNLLTDLSKKSPKKNIRQLLDSVRGEHLGKLQETEFAILDNMKAVDIKDSEDKKNVHEFLDKTREIIENQDKNYIFRRRRFLEKLDGITSKIKDEESAKTLNEMAQTMPTPYNNLDAFVIKYSQKNPKNGIEMLSKNAVGAMLRPSIGAIEHIVPRNPKDKTQVAGKNRVSNYFYACNDCNSEKSNMPLAKYIEKHPEAVENAQKYIDVVIDKINNGAMKGFRAYPLEVAETLEKETNGKIKLDTSKLKITKAEAKKEIAEREKRYKKEEKRKEKQINKKTFNQVA